MNKTELKVKKVIFGIGTGVLPTVSFTVADEEGMTVAMGNIELSLEASDYTVSELQAAAKNKFYEVLEHLLNERVA